MSDMRETKITQKKAGPRKEKEKEEEGRRGRRSVLSYSLLLKLTSFPVIFLSPVLFCILFWLLV